MNSPTLEEVFDVTRKAVAILRTHGLNCCLVGGAACTLFGTTRVPHDVDLLVLTSAYGAEALKVLLVRDAFAGFYLIRSKKLFANYKILYCRLPGYRRFCKVDILVPGILDIPDIPISKIVSRQGHPVMPLIPLLLLKLQAWVHHRASDRIDMQMKQHVDVRDIDELLKIARRRGEHVNQTKSWLPESFIITAAHRIKDYVVEQKDSGRPWLQLGFEVS